MTSLTRKQNAEAVLSQLRGVGPQTPEEIRGCLGMKKRDVEDAIWLLANERRIEYDYPVSSPLRYKVSS